MPYASWDEHLVFEHELIERAMAVLRSELEGIEAAAKSPLRLRRALDFLLEFGDKVHNAKEERFLFPRLGERGIPTQGGPIGVMLLEHEAERTLLVRLLNDLPLLAAAGKPARDGYVADGLDYLKVRAEHIWKENDVLFAMGRKVLTPADGETLLARFAELDHAAYGEHAPAHFTRMVEEMEAAGGIRTRLVDNLTADQLHGIMEALPFEVTFVDAADTVAYFNRLDKEKIFVRTRSVIGRKVGKCHPEKSVDTVMRIVEGFKSGTMDKAEFWIDFKGDTILIRYFPVRGENGEYLGVLEVTQEVGWIKKLTGQKRLLD